MRAYLQEEPDHVALRQLLLEGEDPVISSALTRLELASAAHAAGRARRLSEPSRLIDRFDTDCGHGGLVALVRLRPDPVLETARRIVTHHGQRTLDAIHLAVALEDGVPLAMPDALVFVTRDRAQSRAAVRLGLEVA